MAALSIDDVTKPRIVNPFVDKLFKLNGLTNVFKLKGGAKTPRWHGGIAINTTQFVATGLIINDDEWDFTGGRGTEKQANER